MSKKMMFCRKCGEKLEENAAFCRYCGCKVDTDKKNADTHYYCEPVQTIVEEDERQCESRSRKQKSAKSSESKGGIKFLALVLAVAVFAVTAFKYPGFLIHREEKTTNYDAAARNDVNFNKINYLKTEESEKLSSEKLSTKFKESGVGVTLTEWIFDEGQEEELEVKSIEPLYDPNGEYVIKAYEVSLGGIHELSDYIEIRIPYDKSFCDAGEDPSQCVGGLYYNEESRAWEEVLYTVDPEAEEIVIETDHFSKFGAITLKNKGRRDAMLCMAKDKVDENFDIGYLDEDQAVQVMKRLCDTETEESDTAKLAGNQVLQQAMDLGGAVSTVSDGMGAAFNFAYYLDLSDLAMQGRYYENGIWMSSMQRYSSSVSYSNNMFNAYNTDMIKKAEKTLSRVGNVVSGCKLVYLAAKAGTGNADQSEIFDLYKQSAGMAVNIGGGVTLASLMGPIAIADTFISYIYEESMDIKESQIEDMYIYFNTQYPGCSSPEVRAGRSAKDWRDVIIRLIEENPEADTAELLENEIDSFANEFWTLDNDQMADVVAQMPKTIKRITVDDERIRAKITNGYKKELYKIMDGVLTSVRNYYYKKMVLKTQQQISSALKFYNQTIRFDIVEENPEKEVKYGGCKCIFAPLDPDADKSNWTSTLPEDGLGLNGEMTLIGHITSGSPNFLLVFDKDADMMQEEPLLIVPFEIDKNNHIQIILTEPKEEASDISKYMGRWYDADSLFDYGLEDIGDGKVRFTITGIYWVEYKYEFDPVNRRLILPAENITAYREGEMLDDENGFVAKSVKKGMVFDFSEDGLHAKAKNEFYDINLVRVDEFVEINSGN